MFSVLNLDVGSRRGRERPEIRPRAETTNFPFASPSFSFFFRRQARRYRRRYLVIFSSSYSLQRLLRADITVSGPPDASCFLARIEAYDSETCENVDEILMDITMDMALRERDVARVTYVYRLGNDK